MPHLDGYEATKIIRKTYSSKQLPIIAMTAHAMESDRQKCSSVGMNDYISKPIDPDLLLQILIKYFDEIEEATVSSSANTADIVFPEIGGIDFQDGLKRLKNNHILYIKLLNMFVAKHGNAVAEIKRAFENQNNKQVVFIVHTIKGAAANLGEAKVSNAASAIEIALNNNEVVSELQLSQFSDALAGFVNAIKLISAE